MEGLLLAGLLAGVMSAGAFIFLVEKAGPTLKRLLIGHYLVTDVVGTLLAFTFLPVVGLATLVSASAFCLIFTLYLSYRRKTIDYITISQLLRKKIT